jgi:hypothetical protein
MISQTKLFQYVKDHLDYFGFFPCNFKDIKTNEVIKYPLYMKLFNQKQIQVLAEIFNKHEEYIK